MLRPWQTADAPAVREAFSDPLMLLQFDLPGRRFVDEIAAAGWVDRRRQDWERGASYSWAVTGEDGGSVLGSVTVSHVNRVHDTGWVSYWTTGSARNRGVARSALRALARWSLTDLGLFRLELAHRADNPASCRVATAAGFTAEGVQRAKLRYGDERHDVELHARLTTDPADAET